MQYFMIIDHDKNTIRVPANSPGMAQVLKEIKSEDIHTNSTQAELLADVKAYIKENES